VAHLKNMTGQAAIVTGGSKGIGYACAKRLRDAGCSVLI
jgi:NAD(P)-dependent dehydrogenase (short-subunit alcohol dehydrogenase family)